VPQLKDVFDYDERWRLMNAITNAHYDQGQARDVALLSELDRQAARRLHADAVAEGLGQGLADQPALGF
jgi:hypothetical protein